MVSRRQLITEQNREELRMLRTKPVRKPLERRRRRPLRVLGGYGFYARVFTLYSIKANFVIGREIHGMLRRETFMKRDSIWWRADTHSV